jgi:hypothetical protein
MNRTPIVDREIPDRALCPRHAEESRRWLDSIGPGARPIDLGIQIHTVGSGNAREITDGIRDRAAIRYDLVRSQLDLITTACAGGRGCSADQGAAFAKPGVQA